MEVAEHRLAALLLASLLLVSCGNALQDGPSPSISILPNARPGIPKTACSADPLARVYNPSRLKVIKPCQVFTGTVQGTMLEEDGDYHIYLTPDSGEMHWAMNAENRVFGWALAERMPMQKSIPVPQAGDHVKLVGTLVLDTNHGWLEVAHPIFAEQINGGRWRVWR